MHPDPKMRTTRGPETGITHSGTFAARMPQPSRHGWQCFAFPEWVMPVSGPVD